MEYYGVFAFSPSGIHPLRKKLGSPIWPLDWKRQFICSRSLHLESDRSVKGEFTRKSILVKIAVTVGCLAVGTFMTIGNGQVSYNADSYGTHGFGYFLVMAIMLCVGFVSLAMCFPNGVTPINYVGRNTVGIMVMHKFPILFFVGLLPISKKLIGTYPLVASSMIAILSIGMCLAASEVIYRVCPIALGKRKR